MACALAVVHGDVQPAGASAADVNFAAEAAAAATLAVTLAPLDSGYSATVQGHCTVHALGADGALLASSSLFEEGDAGLALLGAA